PFLLFAGHFYYFPLAFIIFGRLLEFVLSFYYFSAVSDLPRPFLLIASDHHNFPAARSIAPRSYPAKGVYQIQLWQQRPPAGGERLKTADPQPSPQFSVFH